MKLFKFNKSFIRKRKKLKKNIFLKKVTKQKNWQIKKLFIKKKTHKFINVNYIIYKILLQTWINRGNFIKSNLLLMNLLKFLKLHKVKKKKINSLKLLKKCLKRINPFMRYKIFYKSGKKYVLPIIAEKKHLISRSIQTIKKFSFDRTGNSSIVKLGSEILDIFKRQGKTYNYICTDWRLLINENRRLLYLFNFRRRKYNAFTKILRKVYKKKIVNFLCLKINIKNVHIYVI